MYWGAGEGWTERVKKREREKREEFISTHSVQVSKWNIVYKAMANSTNHPSLNDRITLLIDLFSIEPITKLSTC